MSKKICIFGASTTWGAKDSQVGGWVNRLRLYIENELNRKYQVYNLGVSGATSDDLIKRFNVEAEARRSEIIIFAMGANDASFRKFLNSNLVSLNKYKENVEKLCGQALKFTKKIIFVEQFEIDENRTMPVSWDSDVSYKNKDIKQYNLALKNFCQKNNIQFIELFGLLSKADLDDGMHPNAKGHEKIFQKVKDYLIDNKII